MEFVETSIFTQRITTLLTDDVYHDLQAVLAEHPKAGDIIPGVGGLRKIRWRVPRAGASEAACVPSTTAGRRIGFT